MKDILWTQGFNLNYILVIKILKLVFGPLGPLNRIGLTKIESLKPCTYVDVAGAGCQDNRSCQWGKRQCEIPEHTGESLSASLQQWPGMYNKVVSKERYLSVLNDNVSTTRFYTYSKI